MSPSLLAHLQRIARQTRRDVQADNRERGWTHHKTAVTDFYRPLELMARCPWTRPS